MLQKPCTDSASLSLVSIKINSFCLYHVRENIIKMMNGPQWCQCECARRSLSRIIKQCNYYTGKKRLIALHILDGFAQNLFWRNEQTSSQQCLSEVRYKMPDIHSVQLIIGEVLLCKRHTDTSPDGNPCVCREQGMADRFAGRRYFCVWPASFTKVGTTTGVMENGLSSNWKCL